MKGLFKKLRFWIILGFIISLVIIVIVGYLYNWSMEVRVLSIIILVFLLIFIFMLMSLRAARKARKVEQQVKAQTYSDKLPERQREIDDFKKKMQSAIQSL